MLFRLGIQCFRKEEELAVADRNEPWALGGTNDSGNSCLAVTGRDRLNHVLEARGTKGATVRASIGWHLGPLNPSLLPLKLE